MPAHYTVVEGFRLPAKIGGHPVLDFCNTFSGWDGRDPWDYLQSYDHLAVWAGFSGLLADARVVALRAQASAHPRAAATALDHARALREVLYDVLRRGGGADSLARLNADVGVAAAAHRLRAVGDEIEWDIDPALGLATPAATVAWSAGQLLTSPDRALTRTCPGHACGWLFLDRRGRRRWCTMQTCGNREKVRRFAARQRGS
jgi:predicted RNA-binding Zn ribbon-like protein